MHQVGLVNMRKEDESNHQTQEHHGWVRGRLLVAAFSVLYVYHGLDPLAETGRKLLIWEGYKRNHKGAIPPAVSSW